MSIQDKIKETDLAIQCVEERFSCNKELLDNLYKQKKELIKQQKEQE